MLPRSYQVCGNCRCDDLVWSIYAGTTCNQQHWGISIYIYMFCVCMHTHTSLRMNTHTTHIHMCMCICVCVCVCVCVWYVLASFLDTRKIRGSACPCMREVSMVTCIYQHALPKPSISVYLLISHTTELRSLWDTFGGAFKVIALTATAYIISFRAIDELQRERLHHSRATVFTWNGQMGK